MSTVSTFGSPMSASAFWTLVSAIADIWPLDVGANIVWGLGVDSLSLATDVHLSTSVAAVLALALGISVWTVYVGHHRRLAPRARCQHTLSALGVDDWPHLGPDSSEGRYPPTHPSLTCSCRLCHFWVLSMLTNVWAP